MLALKSVSDTADGVPARARPVLVDAPPGTFLLTNGGRDQLELARTMVSRRLDAGKAVVILDYSAAFLDLADAVGGTWVSLYGDGSHQVQRLGAAALVIYDFYGIDAWSGPLPAIPACGDVTRQGLVLVNDTPKIQQVFPGVLQSVRRWVEAGAHFVVVGRHEADIAKFRALPGEARTFRIHTK